MTPATDPPPAAPAPPGLLVLTAIAGVSIVGPLAVHLYFPAIPAVREAFAITDALAQATASLVLFAMAFFNLVYGTLSDRYGRRPMLLIGIALFLAGSVLAALAGRIEVLLAGRLLQAVGAACGITLSRTIAHDMFPPDRLVRALALMTMAYTLGPMVAPPLGGLVIDLFGWRALFVVAFVLGAIIFVLSWFVLAETRPQGRAAPSFRVLLLGYRRLFASARFAGFVFQSGFSTGTFLTLASGASFVMRDYLDRPAAEYGLWFLVFPTGFFVGSFISNRLGGRVRIEAMVLAGAAILVLSAASAVVVVLADAVSPASLFLPGLGVTFAQGLALPNAQAGAMAIDRTLAGTASGIGVFMQFFCGAVMSQVFGVVHDGTAGPLAAIMLASACLSFASGLVPWIGARRAARSAAPPTGRPRRGSTD